MSMFTIQNYEIHPDLFYDPEEHFWLKIAGNRARVGYDPLVQESMGAFVVVQPEDVGTLLNKGESVGTIEAEKYVGPLCTSVSGKIVAVNEQVVENPRLANTDPYGKGWFIEIAMSDFVKERESLLTGKESLQDWFENEIKKYQDKGWLAEH